MRAAAESTGPPDAPRSASQPLLTLGDLPWLAVAVLASLALRVLWVAYVNVDPNDGRGDDTVFYHNVGHVLAGGAGYVNYLTLKPTAHWPPAYPAALAALYKVFWWDLLWAKGLNVACAVATVVLVFLIGRRLFDRRAAYAGALILAFFPGQIYFSTLVLAETMFAMVFLLVLLLALVWTVEPREAIWWHVLVLGVLVGVAGMVRSEGVFLAPALIALWALTARPWGRVARYAALVSAGVALALVPWTVRNAVQLHEFVPLRANATTSLARALEPGEDRPAIRLEQVQHSVGEGLSYQLAHPWEIPVLAVRKARNFYENDSEGIEWIRHGPRPGREAGYRELMTDSAAGRWRLLANAYFFTTGTAALIAGAVYLLRGRRSVLVLLVPWAAWTLLFSFINPVSRFHFALGPVFAVLAGAALVLAWDEAGARIPALVAGRRPPELPPASEA